MSAVRWFAGVALAAAMLLVWRAYDSMAMQLAWERLLAFCGHS